MQKNWIGRSEGLHMQWQIVAGNGTRGNVHA